MIGSVGFWLAADAARTFGALNLDAGQVDALARARLGRLLFHLAHNNIFYGRRFQDAGIEWADPILAQDPYRALAALPPVTKLELRRAGQAALTGGRVLPTWRSSSSSGSTGEPFRVFYDPRAWATLKHLVKLRARWACGVRATDRVAVLDAVAPGTSFPGMIRSGRHTPGSASSSPRTRWRVPSRLSGRMPSMGCPPL